MSTQAVRGAGRAVRRPLGPAVIAMIVALAGSGLAPAVRAHAAPARLPYDAATLSEIAEDVVRRALTGRRPAPEVIAPDADPVQELDSVEVEPDPPLAHMTPARAGDTVRVAPGVATVGNVKAPRGTGYVSNTGQQRRESAQSQLLTFSSGALRPAPGLDPALQAHATTVDARGRQVVYGFLLLRIRPDESLERTLAGLGVALLGPHDDAHKARLPM